MDEETRIAILKFAEEEGDKALFEQVKALCNVDEGGQRPPPETTDTTFAAQNSPEKSSQYFAAESPPPLYLNPVTFTSYISPLRDQIAENAGVLDTESITIFMQMADQEEEEENRRRRETALINKKNAALNSKMSGDDFPLPEPPAPSVPAAEQVPTAPPLPQSLGKAGVDPWSYQAPPYDDYIGACDSGSYTGSSSSPQYASGAAAGAVTMNEPYGSYALPRYPHPPSLQRKETDESTRELIRTLKFQDEEEEKLLRQDEEERTMMLLEEEKLIRDEELEMKRYKCPICFEEFLLHQMVTLSCQPIGHRFCKGCFAGYCESKINDAQVTDDVLVCPAPRCGTAVTSFELEAVVSEEIYTKFNRFLLRSMAESENWRTCPCCNDWFADIPQGDGDAHVWQCVTCELDSCGKKFCGRCGQSPHKGQSDQDISCEGYAKWMQENSGGDQALQDLLKDKTVQQCPVCKNAAELIPGGCKFTYCRCKAKFCFLCGTQLQDSNHFSHFKGNGMTGPFGVACRGQTDPEVKQK